MAMNPSVKIILGLFAFSIFRVLAVFPAVPVMPIGCSAVSLLGGVLYGHFLDYDPTQVYASIDNTYMVAFSYFPFCECLLPRWTFIYFCHRSLYTWNAASHTPVFSAYTTEPSTAPFTPSPESVQLTTPSSPEVSFAQLLTSSLEHARRNSGTNQKFALSHYEFQSYPLYP